MTQKISSVNIETATLASFSGPTIANVSIANSTYTILDDTAVSNAGGYVVITGSNFQSGAQVLFGSTSACTVTFVDSTQLNVQVPALTAGSYVVYVQNGDGSTAVRLNGITSSPIPVWSTGSTLTQQDSGTPISISLAATSDSNVSYSVANGSSLPSGTTLAANGLFSGTVTIETETTYNFSVNAIDAENQDTSRSFSVTVTAGDQYYYLTTLHLSGEAPANNWISDASANNFAITVSGDTRPVAFSPYERNWSVYFDGTDDYVYAAANTAFDLPGDFTIECWANFSNLAGNRLLVDTYIAGDNASYQLYWRTTGSSIVFYTPGDGVILQDPSSSTVVINKWYHIAVVRSGTTAKLYIDGQEKASATLTRDLTHGNDLALGIQKTSLTNDLTGYISNVRIVKGTAVYTSNFTPPTEPLTAISGTTFLACQSNRFIDNSTNNLPLIVSGTPSVGNYAPFTETDLVTGSGYFDGTGDYLLCNEALDVITSTSQSWTVECWLYPLSAGNAAAADDFYFIGFNLASGGTNEFLVACQNYYYNGNPADLTITILPFRWTHFAAVYNGSNTKLYVNGVLSDTASGTVGPLTDCVGGIGCEFDASNAGTPGNYFNGYISNFRFVADTQVYTENFTPPTAPLTAITGTNLLTLQNRFGENNNRFIDYSGTTNLITRVGNSTQGTFSPFSHMGWSNHFDGTGDVLYPPDSQAALTPGTSSTATYTVEGWYYLTGAHKNYTALWDWRSTGNTNGYYLRLTSSGYLQLTDSSVVWTDTSNYINQNTWYHVAFTVVSNGTSSHTYNVYLNGQLIKTGTNSVSSSSGRLTIGSNTDRSTHTWQGYISNFRVVNGTAVYTNNFTTPTSTLTAISNTSLLTCQSNRFVDNSTNNFTITKVNDVSIQAFNPFRPTTEWSLSTVGGSMYFDGTGDYLSCPDNANLNPNTNDFIMEAWVYITGTTGSNQGFNGKGTAGTDGYSFYITNALVLSFIWNGTGGATITAGTLKLNSWHHVAVVRNSNVIRLYLDGVGAGSSTACTTDITTTGIKYIGQARGANPMKGYMSGYRMIKGNLPAGYDATSSTITVPSLPLEAIKSTSVLLNGINGGIIDYTSENILETVGNVQLSTSVKKYGNTSISFDGTGDYLTLPPSPNFAFGTGAFTIEGWVRINANGDRGVFQQGTSSFPAGTTNSLALGYNNSGTWQIYAKNTNTNSSATYSTNTWYHFALVRSGTTTTLYIDGTSVITVTSDTTDYTGTYFGVGSIYGTSGTNLNGYIDDLRITRYARYTSNFTPPASAFKLK